MRGAREEQGLMGYLCLVLILFHTSKGEFPNLFYLISIFPPCWVKPPLIVAGVTVLQDLWLFLTAQTFQNEPD